MFAVTKLDVWSSFVVLLASGLLVGCGDDEGETGGSGGEGGQGAGENGGSGGGEPAVPRTLESARAPDENTVVLQLAGNEGLPPEGENFYALTSLKGDILVSGVVIDEGANTVTLTTDTQKLGVEYSVRIAAPGNPLDTESARFMAADTAKFWTIDYFVGEEVEVVATRQAVGETIVIYATLEGETGTTEVDDAVGIFDDEIFPIETAALAAAPDRDDNGKIVILGLDGQGAYAGYFNPLDSLPEGDPRLGGFHTNEKEVLYISTPDVGFTYGPYEVIAHEFSHLLYNESHDWFDTYWPWHNEGLAECAVHLVAGANEFAAEYYLVAPGLQDGLSLVRWQDGNYDQYAQAYVFWTYVASRLGGVDGYPELFHLTGDPADLDAFVQEELGVTLAELHLDMLAATWVQAAEGPLGYEGMIEFSGQPQLSTSAPQDLESFESIFITGQSIATPIGAGPDVAFLGVSGAGEVDDTDPYNGGGGTIIALNANQNANTSATQSTGILTAQVAPSGSRVAPPSRAWMHPPPFNPHRMDVWRRWRLNAHGF